MRFSTMASIGAAFVLSLAMASGASAQVTPEQKAQIAAIGRVVDPPSTAELYAPLQAKPPYAGVKVSRDLSYGPDARNILDVFQPKNAQESRPVLIYMAGGPGNKHEDVPVGNFYDNIMLWAVKNGMIGVSLQQHSDFVPWDAGAHDVSLAIAWTHKNIRRMGGDPKRVFIWAHSAAAARLAHYLAHPENYPAGGVGVKGAFLLAGPYNLAPLQVKAEPLVVRFGMQGQGRQIEFDKDPAANLAASDLQGLRALTLPLFVGVTELDPDYLVQATLLLNAQLCDAGHCPRLGFFKDHGHMSALFAIGTDDVSTSKPLLEWMRSIK